MSLTIGFINCLTIAVTWFIIFIKLKIWIFINSEKWKYVRDKRFASFIWNFFRIRLKNSYFCLWTNVLEISLFYEHSVSGLKRFDNDIKGLKIDQSKPLYPVVIFGYYRKCTWFVFLGSHVFLFQLFNSDISL